MQHLSVIQELSVVNQVGCIVPGLIDTITLKIVNRDRGRRRPFRQDLMKVGCSSSLSHSYECEKKAYVCGVVELLHVE